MLNRFAHALLVLTSLAPVALVHGLSYLPDRPEVTLQWSAVAVGLVVVCVGLLWLAGGRGEREVLHVAQPKNVDKDVLAFLVSYALPLVVPTGNASNAFALLAFLALVAVVLYQAELVHVNPLLGILGYRFYEIPRDGDSVLVITRGRLASGTDRQVVRLTSTLWLESRP